MYRVCVVGLQKFMLVVLLSGRLRCCNVALCLESLY